MARTASRLWFMVALCSAASVISIACQSDSALTIERREPFIYVVLSPEPLFQEGLGDSSLTALLLTAGTPLGSPFRRAQRFETRKVADGKIFTWRERIPWPDNAGVGFRGVSVTAGNYFLDGAFDSGAGDRPIAPLDIFELQIETEGVGVTGRVRVPERPTVSVVADGERRTAHWPRAAAAAGYYVDSDTDVAPGVLWPDTVFEIRYDRPAGTIPSGPKLRVVALDTNLFRYMSDTIARAGITGAFGLFGAATSTEIALPPAP